MKWILRKIRVWRIRRRVERRLMAVCYPPTGLRGQ